MVQISEIKEKVREALIERYSVQEVGGHLYIALPKRWTEDANVKKKDILTVVGNRDLRILNPEDEDELYERISKYVDEPVAKVKEAMKELMEADN